ncbi:hypothetical protein AMTRI_Chr01g105430 [Amborella trichopoda]
MGRLPSSNSNRFKMRLKGIKKKASELSTLCNIDVCVICFGPNGELETWPEDQSTHMPVFERCIILAKSNWSKRKIDAYSTLEAQIDKLSRDLVRKHQEINECLHFLNDSYLGVHSSESPQSMLASLDMEIDKASARLITETVKPLDETDFVGLDDIVKLNGFDNFNGGDVHTLPLQLLQEDDFLRSHQWLVGGPSSRLY